MHMLRTHVTPWLTAMLLTACVSKDPGSLGELEPCDEGSSGAIETTTATATATAGESGEVCTDPAQSYYEPVSPGCADPGVLVLPEAGCYQPCSSFMGVPPGPCTVGVCTQVQVQLEVQDGDCDSCCLSITELCLGDAPDVVCDAVVGTTFASTQELECGLGPDGPVLCNWQITFEEDGDYLWQYSDIGQAGSYVCEGGVLEIDEPALGVGYDPATGILTWDGVEYVAEPA